jgi:hypothetical protein
MSVPDVCLGCLGIMVLSFGGQRYENFEMYDIKKG